MPASTLTPDRLRGLADHREAPGKVISLFMDLDPSTFGTHHARRVQLTALVDELERNVRGLEGLRHDDRIALEQDLDRIRAWFDSEFNADGLQGLALFVSSRGDLFEVLGLDRPVDSGVFINDGPIVEPLATAAAEPDWGVVLVSRREGRILRGSSQSLTEVVRITDDVPGQHKQGGWSQLRYERSIAEDVDDHFRHVADVLFKLHQRRPFSALLVGAPADEHGRFVEKLHSYLSQRLAGRVEVDVENSSERDIAEAAQPLFEQYEREHEVEALERLREGIGRPDGRGAAGLSDVLHALNDQRVEILMLEYGLQVKGISDPDTGWLGVPGETPPTSGIEEEENIIPRMIDKALRQSAEVLVVRHHQDLGPLGGIAAVLRF